MSDVITGQVVYDPRGVVEAAVQPTSQRVQDLKGLRLGVLDNTKWNGRRLLEKTTALMEAEGPFAEVRYYKKESFSKNAAPELIAQIAEENDVVLTAIGD